METIEQQIIDLQKALGEAGGVAWCELYGTKVIDGQSYTVKINLTNRDITSVTALDGLIEAIKHAEEAYHMRPYILKTPSPAKSDFAPVTSVDPFADEPKPAAKPAVRPAKKVEAEETFHCHKFLAGPYKNLVKLDWYTDNIPGKTKFPYLTSYIPVEQAMAWLQPFGDWVQEDFLANKEFSVDLNIAWAYSDKLNSQGKPYKNIVGIS